MPGCPRDGKLTLTESFGRKEVYATCRAPGHGSCIKTKTAKPGPKIGQGRPLGYLAAWLKAGPSFVGSKADHMKYIPSFDERRAARRGVAHIPGVRTLFEAERVPEGDEGSEPDVLQ